MAIEVYANLAVYVKLYLDDNSLKWDAFTLLIYTWNSVLKLWDCLTQKPGLRDINLDDFVQQKIQPRKPKAVHVETLPGILDAVQLTSSMLPREPNSCPAQTVQALQESENDNSDKKNWNSLQNIMENYFETVINQPACSKRPMPAATGCMP
ncbi:uncharacterized protein CIMG_13203 [Coccidioides immitis RS]|uniref:Uncharacterized protein n=1 Tax=Coccidioides immitis (strain RS) TaxID=246410 RepID=A0A0E1RW32_COCIM|nr:uncharacterized protein CIMG_13203 [Coccidioides immitis RS]EAS29691.1 hypothetical protein CIMG_13203 [Coccidioides immitis RS]